jgi:uncharacterized protein (TIGR03435 family)
MRTMTGIGLLVAMAGGALGQTDAPAPAFEVASVKVSAPLPSGVMMFRMGGGPDTSDPGRITYSGVNLKTLVARAYGVKDYQVEGPQWLEGERYDIIATIPKGADKDQVGLMLQRLLAERFNLTLHHESKPMAVYTLSVGKGGPKLREVDPEAPPPPPGANASLARGAMPKGGMRMMVSPTGRRLSGNITIERLCNMLSNLTDRPVIDLTELKATYSFDLSWTPDDNEKMGGKLAPAMAMAGARAGADPPPNTPGQPGPDSANDPGQTLVQALQTNYGLKLEAKKNPADILVIDRAEKVPTEN